MAKFDFKGYLQMVVGIIVYSIGYTCFMLPYKITTGGVGGISALIYYGTGVQANIPYVGLNAVLIAIALYILGWKYCLRTMISIGLITICIGFFQDQMTIVGPEGSETRRMSVGDEKSIACVIGALLEGLGLAFVFINGGSTGGTDIIASSVNKYKDISLGRVMIMIDLIIISCSWFIVHDLETLVISYLALVISMNFLDFVVNSSRQSVQFTIISEHYDKIAQGVNDEIDRGVTILNGQGWYSKEPRQVLLIMARKQESVHIFQIIRKIDSKAFVTMSNVEGVFGEGFDTIKK